MYIYVTALGVLCCFALFVCLTLLASFVLPSSLSLKPAHAMGVCMYVCMRLCFSLSVGDPVRCQCAWGGGA